MNQTCLFGPNFLEKFVGKPILHDPKIAIVELIANAWDAGAEEVHITWPTSKNEQFFSILDDGEGITKEEFLSRWRTLAYDRVANQGTVITVNSKPRSVFGKNGIGRFAGFCFGDSYFVESHKLSESILFEVQSDDGVAPFNLIEHKPPVPKTKKGTRIFVQQQKGMRVAEDDIRAEIGMRFLTDPSFNCYVNGEKVLFSHIPELNLHTETISLESGQTLTIRIIDTLESDKTTKQHGIAWHVLGRLVGESNWKNYGFDEIIDGRKTEAKRYTFIISADFLKGSVKPDWTGFNEDAEFVAAREVVYDFVKKHILGRTKERRKKALESIKRANKDHLKALTPLRVERWETFVSNVQEECPSISERDLTKLAGVLATMEQSTTKFELIGRLHELNSNQIDDLDTILKEWSIDLAKEVLDELQIRIKLLDELNQRVFDSKTREVQDLQPIFHQALWIFGPEYETIEFTSNEGMTRVIQSLFKTNEMGSRNRPDFAILPDSTVGSYSYPTYDDDGGEIGVDKLVVIELKKPTIKISTDEKAQCWKYVSELLRKGLINDNTRVTCFVIGSEVDPIERNPRKENNDRCIIQPMDYQVVIQRAKSRLLKLYDRVNGAPFLENKKEITQKNLNV